MKEETKALSLFLVLSHSLFRYTIFYTTQLYKDSFTPNGNFFVCFVLYSYVSERVPTSRSESKTNKRTNKKDQSNQYTFREIENDTPCCWLVEEPHNRSNDFVLGNDEDEEEEEDGMEYDRE